MGRCELWSTCYQPVLPQWLAGICAQAMDVLPVDDFGVREGWKLLKGLPEQPKPKVLAEIGEAWQPYRSVATWYLWRAVDCFKNKDKK